MATGRQEQAIATGPFFAALSFLLFTAILLFGKGMGLYTDWLWFTETGYAAVFWTELRARLTLGGTTAAVLFLWMIAHYRVARWQWDRPRPVYTEDWLQFPARRQLLVRLDRLAPALILAASLMAGLLAGEGWNQFLLFRNSLPFGATDPVFGRDISLYVFRLPFLNSLSNLVPVLFLAGLLPAAGVYVLQQDIQSRNEKILITPPVRRHLAFFGALFFFWKAAAYGLEIYGLLYSSEGVVFGATYSELHAQLPALRVLQAAAALAGAALLLPVFWADRRAWFAAAGAAAVWAAVWILGYAAYPKFVQRFRVIPNEISLETPYIEKNIAFTRRAYGLDAVTESAFPATGDLRAADLASERDTLDNVRLWDHRPLLDTFSQLQEIRTYYKFVGVDNDRYVIDGRYRQVMLSVRELDHRSLPSRIWINEHLTYTHGYGLVLGPVNEVSAEGLPRLMLRDIPPVTEVKELAVTRPEIYYGELANDYVVVNTGSKELNYPAGDQNVYNRYDGAGGVPLSSFWRKAAFALRFGTMKLLLSGDITPESRLLFRRRVAERVRKIAPFLIFDSDPYPVLAGGRVFWVVDAYTWTDRFPYSQPVGRLNYIRNSVKAVVDAYDGTVGFYAADEADPVLRTYRAIFPGLVKPLDRLPAPLRAHLRYPRGLFEVQAAIYARYHMTDPQVFYNQEDLWTTPNEIFEGGETPVEPYYTIMKLPGGEKEEYILMLPFTPSQKSNLIAWMAARSDSPHAGELLVYRFPKDKLVYGPMQIEARIDQDSQISQQFTLWGQRGVQVLRGNLIVIPVKDSLLYIEPVYLQAEKGKIPELRRVVVAYENRIAMRETLDEALADVFSGWRRAEPARGTSPAASAVPAALGRLSGEAWAVFQRAQEALRRADWPAYGRAMKELEEALRRLTSESGR